MGLTRSAWTDLEVTEEFCADLGDRLSESLRAQARWSFEDLYEDTFGHRLIPESAFIYIRRLEEQEESRRADGTLPERVRIYRAHLQGG